MARKHIEPKAGGARCHRCNRIMKDQKSINIGFGRVCLKKIMISRKEHIADYPCTVVNAERAFNCRARIWAWLDRHPEAVCTCGEPMVQGDLSSYDNPEGLVSPGYAKRQWFYTRCQCGHETSLKKSGIDMNLLLLESEEDVEPTEK